MSRAQEKASLLTREDRSNFECAPRSALDVLAKMSPSQAREFSRRHTSLPYDGSMLLLMKHLPMFEHAWERYCLLRAALGDLDESGALCDALESVVWEHEAFAAVAAWLACEGEHRRQKGRTREDDHAA